MTRRPFASDLRRRRAFPVLEVLAVFGVIAAAWCIYVVAWAILGPR